MVSKEVENVYRALQKGKMDYSELVIKLTKGLTTKNVELIESMAAAIYTRADEETKIEASKRLFKMGYKELIPIDYLKKIKENPSLLE